MQLLRRPGLRDFLLTALLFMRSIAAEYHVSPTGTSRASGTQAHPLSFSHALSSRSPAKPADTIWVHAGIYDGPLISELTGQPGKPLIIRQYPGERATINSTAPNKPALTINGSWIWYWGLEIAN